MSRIQIVIAVAVVWLAVLATVAVGFLLFDESPSEKTARQERERTYQQCFTTYGGSDIDIEQLRRTCEQFKP